VVEYFQVFMEGVIKMYQNIIDKINNLGIIDQDDYLNIGYLHCKRNRNLRILKDIKFDDTVDYIGAYHPDCQDIIFSFPKIVNSVEQAIEKQNKIIKLSKEDEIYLRNFYYLYVLFHELRHVEQHYDHDYNSLTTDPLVLYLYELCDELERNKKTLYDEFHDLFPTEIDANYHGFIDSLNLISRTIAPPRIKNIMLYTTLKSPILNYSRVKKRDISSPFDKLLALDTSINTEIMDKFLTDKNLDLEEKISYGLNISLVDYYKYYLRLEKVRKLIKR